MPNSSYYEESSDDPPSVPRRPRFTPLQSRQSPISDSDNHIIHANLAAACEGIDYVTAVYDVIDGNVDPAGNTIITVPDDNNVNTVLSDPDVNSISADNSVPAVLSDPAANATA